MAPSKRAATNKTTPVKTGTKPRVTLASLAEELRISREVIAKLEAQLKAPKTEAPKTEALKALKALAPEVKTPKSNNPVWEQFMARYNK